MNIAYPTHRFLSHCEVSFYSTQELLKHSAKEITEVELFEVDDQGSSIPVEGGLYDLALGPVPQTDRSLPDFQCKTCGKDRFGCVGHFGHIELPTKVYHPLLFTNMFALLKNVCFHCRHFRQSRLQIFIWTVKLRLLINGQYEDMKYVEELVERLQTSTSDKKNRLSNMDDVLESYETIVVRELTEFVRHSLKDKGREKSRTSLVQMELQQLQKDIKKKAPGQSCMSCRQSSPVFYKIQSKVFVERRNLKRKPKPQKPDGNAEEDDGDGENPQPEDLSKATYLSPNQVAEIFQELAAKERPLVDLLFNGLDQFFLSVVPVPPNRFRPANVVLGTLFENPQSTYLLTILKSCRYYKQVEESKKDQAIVSLQDAVNNFYDSSKLDMKGKQAAPGIKQLLEKKHGLFRWNMMGKRVNYAARSVISPDVLLDTNQIGIPMVFAKRLTYPEPVTGYNVLKARQWVINGPEVHPGATHIQLEDGSMIHLSKLSHDARVAYANQLLAPSESVTDVPKKVFRHVQNGDLLIVNRQPTLHKPSMMGHKARVLGPCEKTLRLHYANCDAYNADFDGDEMNLHFPQNEIARAEGYFLALSDRQYLSPCDGSPLRGLIQDHISIGVLLTLKDTFLTKEETMDILFNALQSQLKLGPPAIMKPVVRYTGKQIISFIILNQTRYKPPLNLEHKCKIASKLWQIDPDVQIFDEESHVRIVDGELMQGVLDKSSLGSSKGGLFHAFYVLYGADVAGSFMTAMGRCLTNVLQRNGLTCRMDDLLLTSPVDLKRAQLIQGIASDSSLRLKIQEFMVKHSLSSLCFSSELMPAYDALMKEFTQQFTSSLIDVCLPWGTRQPFPRNHMSLMICSGAKGSLVNFSQISGCLGQQELEGKRVPIMSSFKFLPCFLPEDMANPSAGGYITSRFLTGLRPSEYYYHCMAGREGLIDTAVKTSRSGYLQRCLIKSLEGLTVTYDGTVRDLSSETVVQFYYGEDGRDPLSVFDNMEFILSNQAAFEKKLEPSVVLDILDHSALKYKKKARKKPMDPILSKYYPWRYLGSTSEKYDQTLALYIKKQKLDKLTADRLKALCWLHYAASLVHPGESVGILAAQSLGEPSTQMTLNTFHLAGIGAKNVTLGIPRLRELLMLRNSCKHPSISLKCSDNNSIKDLVQKKYLAAFVESMAVSQTFDNIFQVKLVLTHEDHIPHVYKWIDEVVNSIHRTIRKLRRSANVATLVTEREDTETHVGIDVREDREERGQDSDEGLSSSTEEAETEEESSDEEKEEAIPLDVSSIVTSKHTSDYLGPVSVSGKTFSVTFRVPQTIHVHIILLPLLEQAMSKVSVHEVPGLSQVYIEPNGVSIEGSNIGSLVAYLSPDVRIDWNSIMSNDISAMANTYGIEAARAALCMELEAVFEVYGIGIDPRHFSLISDQMSHSGQILPCNRTSMSMVSTSVLSKVTFETSTAYLKMAALARETDPLNNHSSRIIMGQVVQSGSGICEIIEPVQ